MSMDIAKKQLSDLDKVIEEKQKELVTMAKYSPDPAALNPLRALYAHFRELIKELVDEQDPAAFNQKFQGVNEAVAGILIVLIPASAPKVQQNMQKAHGQDFDPSQFKDLVDQMNNSMQDLQAKPKSNSNNNNPDDEDFIQEDEEVNNSPEELIDMLDLGKYAKPKVKPGEKDALGGVFEKYKKN